jgi:hypothetical protein
LNFEFFFQISDLASLASISKGSLKTATKLKAESIMWQNDKNNNNSPNLAILFLQQNWNIVREYFILAKFFLKKRKMLQLTTKDFCEKNLHHDC